MRNFLLGMLFIIFLALIGWTISTLYTKNRSLLPFLIASTVPTPTPAPSAPPAPTAPPLTADQTQWLVYASQTNRFAMGHPAAMIPKENADGSTEFSYRGPAQQSGPALTDGMTMRLLRLPRNGQSLQTITQNLSRETGITPAPTVHSVTVSGLAGYTFQTNGTPQTTTTVLPSGTANYLKIDSTWSDPQNIGYSDILNIMLSTIRIVSPSPSTTPMPSTPTVTPTVPNQPSPTPTTQQPSPTPTATP